MTNVFLTSSHLSAILASIIAERRKSDNNYLIIDNYYKKRSLIDLIRMCDQIHEWNLILDESVKISDATDLKPGLRKTLLRKIKNLPGISVVYQHLLAKHQAKYTRVMTKKLLSDLNEKSISECNSLFLLTQTALNEPLRESFPEATIHFYEHGLGDYLYVLKKNETFDFTGLFGEEFSDYLGRSRKSNIRCHGNFTQHELKNAFAKFHPLLTASLQEVHNKKCVLFLMDALEGYNPPQNFWTDYLDYSLQKVNSLADQVVLVKPHPNQSNGVIELTKKYFDDRKIKYVFLDDPVFVSMAVEVLYTYLMPNVTHVISTFSSAIFYLAKYFPESTRFLLLYDFVLPYFKNAPAQYLEHYYGLKPLIDEVFMTDKIERI